ncbi:MAG: HesB/YadR/YfhF family protein [Alicyclobacillus sp.]|nr:HesB/YadR/YfhF family protein [Alicyclobacillus sp.]
MKITLAPGTVAWFRREMNLLQGDAVRFFVKYGGDSKIHPGFSLGLMVKPQINVAASTEVDGISFFVREEDLWFFDWADLLVAYDADEDDIEFIVGMPNLSGRVFPFTDGQRQSLPLRIQATPPVLTMAALL